MTSPQTTKHSAGQQRSKPTRGQRLVAFAFLGAFAATMLTVLLTGLYVRSPRSRGPENPAVELVVGEQRTIHLVFAARMPFDDVELTVDLPPGVELATHPGSSRVITRTALAPGDNALPLTLVARDAGQGQLAALLRAGEERKVFVVDITVARP